MLFITWLQQGILLDFVYLLFSLFFLNAHKEDCSAVKTSAQCRLLLFAQLKPVLIYLTVAAVQGAAVLKLFVLHC